MRVPENIPIDTYGVPDIRSYSPAYASMLRDIGARQHALMSAFGGPPIVHTGYVDGTSAPSSTRWVAMIPPGVTRAQIAVQTRGRAWVTMSTAVDTNGIKIVTSVGTAREAIRWTFGGNDGGTLPDVSRSLILRASPSEFWGTVVVTVGVDIGELFGIAIIPIHVAR